MPTQTLQNIINRPGEHIVDILKPKLNANGVTKATDIIWCNTTSKPLYRDTEEYALWSSITGTAIQEYVRIAALPPATVQEWNELPIGTMATLTFDGSQHVVVRCKDGADYNAGDMSFAGGKNWSEMFTHMGAETIVINHRP